MKVKEYIKVLETLPLDAEVLNVDLSSLTYRAVAKIPFVSQGKKIDKGKHRGKYDRSMPREQGKNVVVLR